MKLSLKIDVYSEYSYSLSRAMGNWDFNSVDTYPSSNPSSDTCKGAGNQYGFLPSVLKESLSL